MATEWETPSEPGKAFRVTREDGGSRNGRRRLAAVGALFLLSGVVLALDRRTPRGMDAAALYSALVLASIWIRSVRTTLALVLHCSLLIALGWQLSATGANADAALFNRSLSAALLWTSGAMVVSHLLATEHFRGLVEAAPAAMIVTDRTGRIGFANPEAERTLGAPARTLEGARLERFLPYSLRTLAGSDGPCAVEGHRFGGDVFPAEVAVQPVKTEFGSPRLVTIRDLTEDLLRDEANERLAAIVRSSQDAIFAKDLEGRITDWNPGAEAMYGYSSEEVLGQSVAILFPPELRGQQDEILATIRAGEVVWQLDTRRRTKHGRIIEVCVTVSPICDRGGAVVGAATIARDVTGERESERLMFELNTGLSLVMPGIATVDSDGSLRGFNDFIGTLISTDLADVVGRSWLDLLAPESSDDAEQAFQTMLREGRAELTARARVQEGGFLELFLVRRLDSDACFSGFHLFVRDVTERIEAEEEMRKLASDLASTNRRLQQLAHIDPLTGLLNRRGLQRHLDRLQASERRSTAPTAAIFVDIDDFKLVNSRYGHAEGDRILLSVAQSLEKSARPTDAVTRIGGDEFLLVLPDTSLGEATLIAERMRIAVADASVKVGERSVSVTCSLGVSLLSSGDTTIEQLVEAVREELSQSKNEGKDRVCAGGDEAGRTPLGDVLAGRGLRAVHQPIYDLTENRIVAFEMLTRGPRGRYENPAVFLDLPHPGAGLTRLDLACLRTCAEAASRLPEDVCIHCNLFPSTLVRAGAARILRELAHAGPDRMFCVEINERDIPGDSVALRENVDALRKEGVQIAIDDVGFGSTSLEALVNLEPDVVKIDRSCVLQHHDTRALERLLTVANALRARVIAEGIEDREVLERMLTLRVRYGQGYLWGRPEPIERPETVLWPLPRRSRANGRISSRALGAGN